MNKEILDKWNDIDYVLDRDLSPNSYCYIHNYILDLQQELQRKDNIINELKDYLEANIEVCDNRLSLPFCNFEKATKERLIFSNCLDKLNELRGK